jgi:5-methylcytosine-specific restriction protein B
LGEAVSLFEPGEPDRTVQLPHAPAGQEKTLQLSPNLLVLGTRNTADRAIARMDIAIRRRFAVIEMWPDLAGIEAEGEELATGGCGAASEPIAGLADRIESRLLQL